MKEIIKYKKYQETILENKLSLWEGDVFQLLDSLPNKKIFDLAGFIVSDKNNVPIFSFGKHKGKSVEEVLENEPGYFGWILNADFPLYTKKVLTSLKLKKMNNKE